VPSVGETARTRDDVVTAGMLTAAELELAMLVGNARRLPVAVPTVEPAGVTVVLLVLVFVAATLLLGVARTVAAFGLITALDETVGLTTDVLLALTGGTDDDATVVPAKPDEELGILLELAETVDGATSAPVVLPRVVPPVAPTVTLLVVAPVEALADTLPVLAVEAAVVAGMATKAPLSPITTSLPADETDEFTVDCGLAMRAGLTNCPVG